MSDTKKRILDLLEAGKISSEEAMKLLSATEEDSSRESGESGLSALKKIKYLRVIVDNPNPKTANAPGKVNIRVPVSLIRAGMKFTSLIPGDAANNVESALREKGVNLNLKNIKGEDVDELIDALRELEVDIDGGEGKVRVYAE
jgi:hypothetical protein